MELTKDNLPISFFDEIECYDVIGKFDGIEEAEKAVKQILKNQEDAKVLPEAQKCRDYWFDKFTALRKLWIDFQDELHNSSDEATGARHDLFKAIFTDDELQKILEDKK